MNMHGHECTLHDRALYMHIEKYAYILFSSVLLNCECIWFCVLLCHGENGFVCTNLISFALYIDVDSCEIIALYGQCPTCSLIKIVLLIVTLVFYIDAPGQQLVHTIGV